MAMRKFVKMKCSELREIYEKSKDSLEVLRDLDKELKHRHTKISRELSVDVKKRLQELKKNRKSERHYEIIERIAVISENQGWTKELNRVSWYGHEPKLDLRNWYHKDGRMGKGITFTSEELVSLRNILNDNQIE